MPASFVTAESVPICAGLVAVTVTPGSTPPCASLISPLMLPVELAPPPCANADVPSARTAASAQMMFLQPVMWKPPGARIEQGRCRHAGMRLVSRGVKVITRGTNVDAAVFNTADADPTI